MKIFLISLILIVIATTKLLLGQNTISDVQIKNNWIIVYDTDGKQVSQMPKSDKEVVAVDGGFFVATSNNWIITFNDQCKEIARISQSDKQVREAAGNTFTVLNNDWLIIYDKYCKEKNRRPNQK